MKTTHSVINGSAYIYIDEKQDVASTQTLLDEDVLILVDRDNQGNVIGVEVTYMPGLQ